MFLDVILAHSYNRFGSRSEWIPVVFSLVGSIVLLRYLILNHPSNVDQNIARVTLVTGFAVGVLGFYFHLKSAALHEISLKSLVYAAPLVAPLAYAGNAIVALVSDNAIVVLRWSQRKTLLLLVAGGFSGNFFLSVLDHARNGFFYWSEWISVFVSIMGASAFAIGAFRSSSHIFHDKITLLGIVLIHMIVGLLGFYFHFAANLHNSMPHWMDKFIFGTPVFAPLLLADVALLGFIAIMMDESGSEWLPIKSD